jgi:hypothetical protein
MQATFWWSKKFRVAGMPEYPAEWYSEAFRIPAIENGEFNNEYLLQVFNEIDTDGKGYINRSDVRLLMNKLGEEVDEKDLDEMMKLVDPEGTGSIPPEIFIDSFMNPLPLFQNPFLQPGSIEPTKLPVKR